jgi:hypothetical protein
MSAPLDAVDAELARWRERLSAASRNVSELSELPEFAAARAAAKAGGRLGEEARGLVATMDELWQGVLLIGGALDRAEAARASGSRLWRAEDAAKQAHAILHGPSVTVDLSDTPVLHRRLLAGPRATATVSLDTLLQAMDAAFDKARATLEHITAAADREAGLRRRLAEAIARLPAPDEARARLAAADGADPLDRLDALEALAVSVDKALVEAEQGRAGLDAARRALAALQERAAQAGIAAASCRACVAAPLPMVDDSALRDLAAWLERIERTLASGRTGAGTVGLANWRTMHDSIASGVAALASAAAKALARRDDLRARLGALRAKHHARPEARPEARPDLAELEAAAKQALAQAPADLDAAARHLGAYEAALRTRTSP